MGTVVLKFEFKNELTISYCAKIEVFRLQRKYFFAIFYVAAKTYP